MQDNFAGCPVWSRASEEDDNSEHCCPSPLIIRTLCAFRTEIGTVQTWIMMHRICVCLHTDSMRSVIECRGDWLQLSHLEVESIAENCMSVKCSEPSWLWCEFPLSSIHHASSNNGFSRLFERLHLTHIEYLGHWIACKKTLLVALCDRAHQRKMIIPNIVVHHLWISVPCVAFDLR